MDKTLALALALMDLLEELVPMIGERVKSGTVSAEDQANVLNKFESLKARAGGEFGGDHWRIDPDPLKPHDTTPW